MNAIIKQEAVSNLAMSLSVDAEGLLATLQKTVCKDIKTNEELLQFIIVCSQYKLNPMVKEIYAFKNKFGVIVPVVGVDGWLSIANRNPMFDGIQCTPTLDENGEVENIVCLIWRKDRAHPAKHMEYMRRCKRETTPWKSHPERMLEWKAIIQTIRIAFSISGIYDPDEAELIKESNVVIIEPGDKTIIEQPSPLDDLIDVASPDEETEIIGTPGAVVKGGKYDKPKQSITDRMKTVTQIPGECTDAKDLKTEDKPKRKPGRPKKEAKKVEMFPDVATRCELPKEEIRHLETIECTQEAIGKINWVKLNEPVIYKQALDTLEIRDLKDCKNPSEVQKVQDEITQLQQKPE